MGVLSFDGINDQLKWTTLAQTLRDVSDGAWTVGILVKMADVGHFNGFTYLLSGAGAGTTEAGLSFSNSLLSNTVDVGSGYSFPSNTNSTASPYIFVVSKGAGTVNPRLGWKLGVGGSWTHENNDVGGGLPDQIDSDQLQIGTWQDSDFMEGWIGLIGWWEGAMSDADKEALDNNWATSDWWNSAHGQPKFLAELNVAGASVVDIAGNASSLTATGTTLDGAETLDSWNFDGTGTPPVEKQSFYFSRRRYVSR